MTVRKRYSLPREPVSELVRPRLDERLDAWAPVSIVYGGLGTGKTAAVAGWLGRQPASEVTALWITLTAPLAEPSELLEHLSRRLRAARLAPTDLPPHPAPALAALDEALIERGPGARVALVIDTSRYRLDPQVAGDLISIAQRHATLHLIICTRYASALLDTVRSSGALTAIGPDELALTVDEVIGFSSTRGIVLSPEDAAALHRSLGGWLGATAVALANGDGPDAWRPAAYRFLRDTVLPDLDDDARALFMRSALARELDSGLMSALVDGLGVTADQALAMLSDAGAVRAAADGSRTVLRMPKVLRAVLSEQFLQRDPDGARALHARIARWHRERAGEGDAVLALEHAVAAQDWALAHDIWAEHGFMLVGDDLLRWADALRALPSVAASAYPAMALSAQILRSQVDDNDVDGRGRTIRLHIEGSAQIVRRGLDGLPIADLLFIAAGHLMGLRASGRLPTARAFADRVDERVEEHGILHPRLGQRLGWLRFHEAGVHVLTGDRGEAIRLYLRGWGHRTGSRTDVVAAANSGALAMLHALQGAPAASREWLERHDRLGIDGTWAQYLLGAQGRIARAVLALDRLDDPAVRKYLDDLGDGSAQIEIWPVIARLNAEHALHFGSAVSGLQALAAAESVHSEGQRSTPLATLLTIRARADLMIAAGMGQQARTLLATTPDLGAAHEAATIAVPRVRIALMSGQYERARVLAGAARAAGSGSGSDLLELTLLDAVAALRLGAHGDAGALARQALDLLRTSETVKCFATIGAADRETLLQLSGGALDPESIRILALRPPVYPAQLVLIDLTAGERRLVEAMLEAGSRAEVARALHLSRNTVKSGLSRLYRKLGTTSQDETLRLLDSLGLLPHSPKRSMP